MKRYLPYLFIIFLCCTFFYQFLLKGLLPIPSDTIVGLYHPFRDLYASTNPNGLPYKNFLITDPVRQEYPWRELAIADIKQGVFPTWDRYSFSGYPLLANIQTAVFYPLNIIFFLTSFPIGWSLLIFLQPLLGGVFFYLFLRHQRVSILASLVGVTAFIFSGFFISWLEWGTVIQSYLWLPLILLCVDYLIEKKTQWYWQVLFVFSVISSFLAGHWQTFFYIVLLTCSYAGYMYQDRFWKKKILLKFIILSAIIITITAVQWLPSLQFISHSARDIDQLNEWKQAGWFIPWQHLVQFIAPDFFGNPTTLNYWGVWNYAELVGYVGIIPLFFAVLAMVFVRSRFTLFFSAVILIALLFSLPTYLSAIPFLLHIPFLSTAQPTRLLSLIDFSLPLLAAVGIDHYIKTKQVPRSVLILFSIIFLSLWGIVVFHLHTGSQTTNWLVTKNNLSIPTGIFLVFLVASLFVSWLKEKKYQVVFLFLILGITALDMVRFGWKFTPFTTQSYLYPATPLMSLLKSQKQPFRIMTTDDRILPPNFSAHYHIESVDGYDPLYLRPYAQLIASVTRNKPDIGSPLGFHRIITPHTTGSSFMDLLGVKYVLSFDDLPAPQYKKISQEGQTKLYENTKVFPRVFFVTAVVQASSDQDAIEKMFANRDVLSQTAVVQAENNGFSNLGEGNVTITNYSENNIVFQTQNMTNGFVVVTENYYPSWKATIDGKAALLYRTDFSFVGLSIPKGNHIVELSI